MLLDSKYFFPNVKVENLKALSTLKASCSLLLTVPKVLWASKALFEYNDFLICLFFFF